MGSFLRPFDAQDRGTARRRLVRRGVALLITCLVALFASPPRSSPPRLSMAMPQAGPDIRAFLRRTSRSPSAHHSPAAHARPPKRRGRPAKAETMALSGARAAPGTRPRGRPRKRVCMDPITSKDKQLLYLALRGTTGMDEDESDGSAGESYHIDEKAGSRRSVDPELGNSGDAYRSIAGWSFNPRNQYSTSKRSSATVASSGAPAPSYEHMESLPHSPLQSYTMTPVAQSDTDDEGVQLSLMNSNSSAEASNDSKTPPFRGIFQSLRKAVGRILFSPPDESKPNSPPPQDPNLNHQKDLDHHGHQYRPVATPPGLRPSPKNSPTPRAPEAPPPSPPSRDHQMRFLCEPV